MYIPRADGESDGCASGHVYCTPNTGSVAIVGDNSGDTADGPSTTNYKNNKPGLHRYIGIVMVMILVIVAFCSWVYYMKRSRPSSPTGSNGSGDWICCGSRKKSPSTSGEAPEDSPDMRAISEKERSTMLQSEPKGLIKEVSGGVVMFTEAPRPAVLPSKDRYPMGWEFEHVKGVRFEVSTK